MAVALRVDGSCGQVLPKQPPAFTFEELRGLVGGYLEFVALVDGHMMVIDEESKLKGLAYNEQATLRARGSLLALDYIAGPAVVVSRQEMGE